MDYEALGKRVRQQRKLANMTQSQLAAAIQVSTSYIGHIERGIKHCSLETVVDLSILLQDSLDNALITDFNDMSVTNRSILNDIAHILREYDTAQG